MAKHLVTLGMFIIDQFEYRDKDGNLLKSKTKPPQIGGGGTYAAIGARIFLEPKQLGMIVDKGSDFPADILTRLLSYGEEMWSFRNRDGHETTRALNKYTGEHRGFEYLTPRIQITPKDLDDEFSKSSQLHFICSPVRAAEIIREVRAESDWTPLTIYEPIPDRCIPKELPSLMTVLPEIDILSPNCDEALSLLGIMDSHPTRAAIEQACKLFLTFGVGRNGQGWIIIRSGHLGACVATRGEKIRWVDAFFRERDEKEGRIIDVTGAGNCFLGGLSAGLLLTNGDVYEGDSHAAFYASVSASFAIEQFGLPRFQPETNKWNNDDPIRRLRELRVRHAS